VGSFLVELSGSTSQTMEKGPLATHMSWDLPSPRKKHKENWRMKFGGPERLSRAASVVPTAYVTIASAGRVRHC